LPSQGVASALKVHSKNDTMSSDMTPRRGGHPLPVAVYLFYGIGAKGMSVGSRTVVLVLDMAAASVAILADWEG